MLVLTAVHAAGPHVLSQLLLTDLDISRGQLVLSRVPRSLDDLSTTVLTDWLRYRRRTWPLTANPHLLISPIGALTGKPISKTCLDGLFHDTGVTPDRLRMVRHLEEPRANGPDPLHLAAPSASARPLASDTPPSPNGSRNRTPHRPGFLTGSPPAT